MGSTVESLITLYSFFISSRKGKKKWNHAVHSNSSRLEKGSSSIRIVVVAAPPSISLANEKGVEMALHK